MRELNIRFSENKEVKSEHLGNGEYKKIGYDFYIGSETQARQGSDWRFGYIAFCNYWALAKNGVATDPDVALKRAREIVLTES